MQVVDRVVRPVTTDPERPLRQGRFRSPLRDERLAAWLGAPLGVLFTTCFVTGLFSHVHQHPLSWLPVPARPAGLYRVTQGIHVASGIACLPLLLAKLWVVWPRLLSYPPVRHVADVVERAGVLALVGGGVFMVFSGTANIAQWYPWHFSFTATHYWMAWVTIGALLAHLGAKWAITRRTFSRHRPPIDAADPVLGTVAEEAHDGLTRRGFLTTVAAASGVLTLTTIGQTLPLPGLRRVALLAPRDPAVGPQGRPVNRSAANARVVRAATSPSWSLTVDGRVPRPLSLSLGEVRALPAHEAVLPIACVEGWSFSAPWRGARLRDLLAMAGAPAGAAVRVGSLERNSIYSVSFVDHFQAHDPDTLLATHLDGEVLDLDHGYPLRLISPDRPGVNQTKWVTRVTVL
ncbi:MAG TPA: molybdopterin-dependent oxidoreductase [Acidimicrobiales bacterium]|nr:molybdopterin-dependent oxidoreductase [Acidimicrobiales bacterium]